MRSALTQALDIIGPDADAERTIVLACTIADLMTARVVAEIEASPTYRALPMETGLDRVRAIIGPRTIPCFLIDWTEPEAVLRRLGFVPFSWRRPAAHD